MTDIFESKNIKPMLIGEMSEAFDSPDYIYELKLDGERTVAYLDSASTLLVNKRNFILNERFPELSEIHKAAKAKCILDGEISILKDGKPDFYEVQRRSMMTKKFKLELAASKYPASFTAFDILYYEDRQVTDLPLMERKKLLQKAVKENDQISVSRYIEKEGIAFYQLAKQQDLEGIVAKKKDSKYYLDKRTKEWIKIKNLQDDDFVVCGYILKEQGVISLVLGQYQGTELVYKGHVTLGVSSEDFRVIKSTPKINAPLFKDLPTGNDAAVWLKPELVCVVKYMMKTATGSLRQPIYKGLRPDKEAGECIER